MRKFSILLLILLSGCDKHYEGGWSEDKGIIGAYLDQGEGYGTLIRYLDKEHGVACYQRLGTSTLSCVRL